MGLFDNLSVFTMSKAMAQHSAFRQDLSSRNVAMADRPNYVAKQVKDFGEVINQQGFSSAFGSSIRAEHSAASLKGNGNNVRLEDEFFNSSSALRQHNRAVSIYKSSLNILREAIAR